MATVLLLERFWPEHRAGLEDAVLSVCLGPMLAYERRVKAGSEPSNRGGRRGYSLPLKEALLFSLFAPVSLLVC